MSKYYKVFPKKFLILFFAILPLCFFSSMSISFGVTISYQCFAVSSSGDLYIGKNDGIYVFSKGEFTREIDRPGRSYAFTISSNDTIIASNATYVYMMDINGNILEKNEDINSSVYNQLKNNKTFISDNGSTYKMERPLGRPKIVKDDSKIIYQMPLFDYIVKITLYASYGCFATLIAVFVFSTVLKGYCKNSAAR